MLCGNSVDPRGNAVQGGTSLRVGTRRGGELGAARSDLYARFDTPPGRVNYHNVNPPLHSLRQSLHSLPGSPEGDQQTKAKPYTSGVRHNRLPADLEALRWTLDAARSDASIWAGAALIWYVHSKRHG